MQIVKTAIPFKYWQVLVVTYLNLRLWLRICVPGKHKALKGRKLLTDWPNPFYAIYLDFTAFRIRLIFAYVVGIDVKLWRRSRHDDRSTIWFGIYRDSTAVNMCCRTQVRSSERSVNFMCGGHKMVGNLEPTYVLTYVDYELLKTFI